MAFFESISKWSQILGAIAFLAMIVWLFRKYMLPAVAANEVARNLELVQGEERRDTFRAQIAQARGLVEAADRDATSIKERAVTDAARERERILTEAQHEGARVVKNAEGELERGRLVARDQLRIAFIEKALARARTLAAERLDPAANQQLVNDTVTTLTTGART